MAVFAVRGTGTADGARGLACGAMTEPARTTVDVDDALLAAAAAVLGTTGAAETVRVALELAASRGRWAPDRPAPPVPGDPRWPRHPDAPPVPDTPPTTPTVPPDPGTPYPGLPRPPRRPPGMPPEIR